MRKTKLVVEVPEMEDDKEGYLVFEEIGVVFVAPWLMRKLISKEGCANV